MIDETPSDATDQIEVIAQEMLQRLELLSLGDTRGEISLPQYRMLTALFKFGPLSIGRVAQIIGSAQSTTSEMVARLMRSGLVTKVRGPYDGRVVMVELTDNGRQLLKRSRQRIRKAYEGLYDRLTPVEREGLVYALKQLDGLLRKGTE
jgi:DNA-binding MarR family transcriptional regulator